MTSNNKTIEAATKRAATCKARCLAMIGTEGTLAMAIPAAQRRWLKTLENEGLIEFHGGKWFFKS
jgi:hypothetical protein